MDGPPRGSASSVWASGGASSYPGPRAACPGCWEDLANKAFVLLTALSLPKQGGHPPTAPGPGCSIPHPSMGLCLSECRGLDLRPDPMPTSPDHLRPSSERPAGHHRPASGTSPPRHLCSGLSLISWTQEWQVCLWTILGQAGQGGSCLPILQTKTPRPEPLALP